MKPSGGYLAQPWQDYLREEPLTFFSFFCEDILNIFSVTLYQRI